MLEIFTNIKTLYIKLNKEILPKYLQELTFGHFLIFYYYDFDLNCHLNSLYYYYYYYNLN